MSHPDELLEASIRERRRIWVLFVILLFVFAGVLGTAWTLERSRGDSWRDQALHWQDEYVSLYDEFTVSTGEEPQAPDPSDVAQDAPTVEQGEPGPPGPVGAAGRPGKDAPAVTDAQLFGTVEGYCTLYICRGNDGAQGGKGDKGDRGDKGDPGQPGADSTVPGPAGADGRGIQSLYCDDITGRWTVTYTTGESADAGTCKTPIIEGEPTP